MMNSPVSIVDRVMKIESLVLKAMEICKSSKIVLKQSIDSCDINDSFVDWSAPPIYDNYDDDYFIYNEENYHTSTRKSTILRRSTTSSHLLSKDGGLCRHFTLSEVKLATKIFDESYVITVDGFGKVYKGVIVGTTKVAIKSSNPSSEQGIVHEFQTEIELLSKLRHLVSLTEFCEDGEMALVYDYKANGTLREYKTSAADGTNIRQVWDPGRAVVYLNLEDKVVFNGEGLI